METNEEVSHAEILQLLDRITQNDQQVAENMANLVKWAQNVNVINQNLIESVQYLKNQIGKTNHTHWWQ